MSNQTAPPAAPQASPEVTEVLTHLRELKTKQEALEGQLKELSSRPAAGQAPWARRGEDPFTSRGFSYLKLFGVMGKQLPREHAKVECELQERMRKAYEDQGWARSVTDSVIAPFSSDHLAETYSNPGFIAEVRGLLSAGVAGFDREEVRALRERHWGRQKALSWVDETTGGALVAPPIQGELIEVLRNNEIFMQAGARTIAMPPNGRIVWPRQTSAGTAYWVGQSDSITDSTPGTGDVVLSAKKLACLMKIPNELFRFSSVSVEQFVREDMARVMALKMDRTFLDDVGSSTTPKGLLNYSQITSHTATTVGANGNTFEVDDPAEMIGKVEEQNAVFRAFVMRPLMYTALSTRRSSVYDGASTVAEGPFLFNMWRTLQEGYIDPTRQQVGNLNGYPVFKSTQVSNTRAKGSASNLTYILGGDFTDFMVAMSGAMEFQLSREGDTPFTTDQTWIRSILLCDGAPRREASFIKCDELLIS
ncbi:MAG TPA: phage major capsid protein [bacterium]|nr:phage major capsid protein [bacterium]